MDTVNEFEFERRKYMPVFPKATGTPTIYIEGYPCEDDEPMGATGVHADQNFPKPQRGDRCIEKTTHTPKAPEGR